jgi:hypothetical protein
MARGKRKRRLTHRRRNMWIAPDGSGRLIHVAGRSSDESPRLKAVTEARAALKKAEDIVKARRVALVDRMVEAATEPDGPRVAFISEIARASGYEREHVRRMLRGRNIEAKQDRPPPPSRFKAKADAE